MQCCEPEFWVFLIICLLLVSLAGITSGLALGLLSFSKVDLEVFIKAGRPQDRKYAGWHLIRYFTTSVQFPSNFTLLRKY